MNPKLVVKQNSTLRKVPNFVHLNINSSEQFDKKQFLSEQETATYATFERLKDANKGEFAGLDPRLDVTRNNLKEDLDNNL